MIISGKGHGGKYYYGDSDYLRKMGEQSKLLNNVKCLDGIWKMGRYDLIIMVLHRTKMDFGMSVLEW